MKTYKSKKGMFILIPLTFLLVALISTLFRMQQWFGCVILLLVLVFIIHVFFTTYYQLNGNMLRIKSGFLIDREIDVRTVTKIKETNNPLSAPATSLDRLEIIFNGKDSILISPEDKTGFIADLCKIKPDIEVILKKKKLA
jgi:hypothetical protein